MRIATLHRAAEHGAPQRGVDFRKHGAFYRNALLKRIRF